MVAESKLKAWLCLFLLCLNYNVRASVYRVGPNESIRSIKMAIARASATDTIWVGKGLYFEKNIIIGKPLTLIGDQQPILDGERQYEIFSVKSDHVTIKGFCIRNSGISSIVDFAGIKIYNTRDVSIENNLILDCFFGIYSQYGTYCTIRNNDIKAHQAQEQQSGNGIHCWKSDSMQIIANRISGHRDGIYFEFVTNSVIWRNISSGNLRYGLHFMFSNSDMYAANVFQNNGAGVAVMFSKQVKMFHNTFKDNWGDAAYGLLLKEISDSYIDGNDFDRNTSGIYLEGVSRVEMYNNVFNANGWGMRIQASCMDMVISNNNFTGNTFDVGTNGSLVLNTFNMNYWDKYDGYDLNKDHIGDVPYRPVSLFSMVIEKNPPAMVLFRSLITTLMDRSEKLVPSLTPENLIDKHPRMKPLQL